MRSRRAHLLAIIVALVASACGVPDAVSPEGSGQGAGSDANLRLAEVRFTQGAQEPDGSIPLVAGMPVAVNVLIQRSRESVAEVPVVLRLFRGGSLVHLDTVRTGGVLGASINAASPSAQFLIPGVLVTDSLAWQVEIDPAQSVTDSTRTDNVLPATAPAALNVVHLPPMDVRLVPISLASQGGVTGNVSEANAAQYLSGVQSLLPTGALTFGVNGPLSVQENFGTAPDGGSLDFWRSVAQDLDIARLLSSSPTSTWIGIVPLPPGFTRLTNGGYAFIPANPSNSGAGTRSALALEFTSLFGTAYVRDVLAHELAHTFGRSHAPGCGAGAPIDAAFPGVLGTIGTAGHDVYRWASGAATLALSSAATTGDVMSYCSPVWTSPYTWNAVLRWRQASGSVATSTARTRVTLVAGSVGADGSITVRPALDADALLPPDDPYGDVTVELRSAGGSVLRRTRVQSAVGENSGVRYFVAILRSVGDAGDEIVATNTAGASAHVLRHQAIDEISSRSVRSGATEITSSAGNALLVRDAASGDVLGIGWHGRVVISRSAGLSVTVSDGVRSAQRIVVPR